MSRHQPAWLLLAAPLWLAAAPASAQGAGPARAPLPDVVQEVFLADLVYPQERGALQLTANSRLQHGPHTRVLAEYGITDRLQASLTTPTPEDHPEEGEDAWRLGTLYALVPSGPVSVSASAEVELARGEAPVWTPEMIAAAGWGRLQLHGNASVELTRGETALGGGVAALLDAGPRWTPTVELVGAEGEETFLVPGLFVHLSKGLEAGLGAPLCLSCPAAGRQLRVVVTLEP